MQATRDRQQEQKEEVNQSSQSDWWLQLRQTPKLVCLARTFPKHAQELGNRVPDTPLYFLKSPTSIIGDGEAIRRPVSSDLIHHEAEVAVVLKHALRQGTEDAAMRSIAGYTLLNDVTARDIQRAEDGRFCRAKSFDSFCPMSSEMIEGVDWKQLSVGCQVNGNVRQRGALTDMFMSPCALLSWLSHQLSLSAGDVIALGTPPGVGALENGDLLTTNLYVDGERRLTLKNPVLNDV